MPEITNVDIPSEVNQIDHGDYIELEVPGNWTGNAVYHDNAVMENVLIDQTASGAGLTLFNHLSWNSSDQPENWVIRNVAWVGEHPEGTSSALFVACDSGSTGLVENVWLGDGDAGNANSSSPTDYPYGAGTDLGHQGEVTLRGVYIEGWTHTGFHGSRHQSGANIVLEECYFVGNQISNFRVEDAEIYDSYGQSASSPTADRTLWVWGDTTVDGCSFATGDTDTAIFIRDGASLTMSNTEYDGIDSNFTDGGGNTNTSSPTHFVPDACPETPEEAYNPDPEPDPDPSFTLFTNAPSVIAVGDSEWLEVEIENSGGGSGSTHVEVFIQGTTEEDSTIEIDANSSWTEEYPLPTDAEGEYEWEVVTEFDVHSGNVTVEEDPDSPHPNEGYSRTIELSPGETSVLEVSFQNPGVGTHGYTVTAQSGTDTQTVTDTVSVAVDEPAPDYYEEVTIPAGSEQEVVFTVDGETLTFAEHEWTVTVSGDRNLTQSGTVTMESEGLTPDDPLMWILSDPDGEGEREKFLPVFNPSGVEFPCWRVQMQNGQAGAFVLKPRGSAAFPEYSIDIAGQAWAIDDAGYSPPDHIYEEYHDPTDTQPTPPEPGPDDGLVTKFEDAPPMREWNGDTTNYEIVSGSLRHRADEYRGGRIWSDDFDQLPRDGHRVHVYWDSALGSNHNYTDAEDMIYRFLIGVGNYDEYVAASCNIKDQRVHLSDNTGSTIWETYAVRNTQPVPANTRMRTTIAWGVGRDGVGMRVFNDETNEAIAPWITGIPPNWNRSDGGIGFAHTTFASGGDLKTYRVEIDPETL